jgi:ADP-heptose:LPS heptosyltransferase
LKKEKFDLAVLLQNAFEAAFISFLARIPRRAGYDTDGRGFAVDSMRNLQANKMDEKVLDTLFSTREVLDNIKHDLLNEIMVEESEIDKKTNRDSLEQRLGQLQLSLLQYSLLSLTRKGRHLFLQHHRHYRQRYPQ